MSGCPFCGLDPSTPVWLELPDGRRLESSAALCCDDWHTGAIVEAFVRPEIEKAVAELLPPCAGCSSPLCPDCARVRWVEQQTDTELAPWQRWVLVATLRGDLVGASLDVR